MAEKEGVVHLNELGDTITVQHVFELVLRLKQICNFDPRTGESAKLEQLVADMDEVAENSRKAIIFSQWVEPLETLAARAGAVRPAAISRQDPAAQIGSRSSIGSRPTSRKHVLLMSYGTGSVGLNLQFTNYVFLFDRWWNPAIEDQAINRAHRIGQKETVFVKRFISQDTIEERIAEVLEKKRQLFRGDARPKRPAAVAGAQRRRDLRAVQREAKAEAPCRNLIFAIHLAAETFVGA